jgi:hypothetical protein
MRPFTARRLALAALVPALFVLSVIPGCSNESEGERCGDQFGVSNNDDCGSGLVCTAFTLSDGTTTGRCCYTDHVSDSRCEHDTGVNAVQPNGDAGSTSEAGSTVPTGGGGGETQTMTGELPAGSGGV